MSPRVPADLLLPLLGLVAWCVGAGCGRDPSAPSARQAAAEAPAPRVAPAAEEVGRCTHRDPERRVLFGDLHVHTRFSLDANLQGTRMTPEDAYRFARGERVALPTPSGDPGEAVQLRRPLDFAAITDHAEFLGVVSACEDPSSPAATRRGCRRFREDPENAFLSLNSYLASSGSRVRYPMLCGRGAAECLSRQAAVWTELQNATEAAYDRSDACRFTTLHAYEWSGSPALTLRRVANQHRNVIFRNNVVPTLPADYVRAPDIETLWGALERDCINAGSGCDVLAIPHNSNLSSGTMFLPWEGAHERFTARHAARRAHFEPLFEIYQHKGASECIPGGLAGDEDCGFELLPYDNLAAAKNDWRGGLQREGFVRYALGEGLRQQARLGHNPFRIGFVASTDTHLGVPGAVAEDAFLGGGGAGERGSGGSDEPRFPDRVYFGGGGLAAVWAEENSRPAVFDALRRRETYGTSGPRMTVRVFAGFELDAGWCERSDRVAHGYAHGVPMGGELGPGDGAPTLAIAAARDPGGVGLATVQVIKGYLDERGQARARVYDVAAHPAADADVDLATCTPSARAADQLCATWRDPDFSPDEAAYYYVRVLEQRTCRWTTRMCVAAGYDCDDPTRDIDRACCAPEVGLHPNVCARVDCGADPSHRCCGADVVQPLIRERAWTSPIWYTPSDS